MERVPHATAFLEELDLSVFPLKILIELIGTSALVTEESRIALYQSKLGFNDALHVQFSNERVYGIGQLSAGLRCVAQYENEIAVVDAQSLMVLVFDVESGVLIRQVCPTRDEGGVFVSPHGVAFNQVGYMYVSDWGTGNIKVFDRMGDYVRDVACYLPQVQSLAFAPNGDLVVINGDKILVLREDYARCVMVHTFGSTGSSEGMLRSPRGVCVARDGTIIIADFGNCRICLFDCTGAFQSSFIQVLVPGELMSPHGIAVGQGGDIVVSDHTRDLVCIFTRQGKLVQRLSKNGNSRMTLSRPWGVAVNEQGDIFVADRVSESRGRLQQLSYAGQE
jgi:DNA-binding beta-propeller fold protein YncE